VVLHPADPHSHRDSNVDSVADRHALLFADRFADRLVISYTIILSYVDT